MKTFKMLLASLFVALISFAAPAVSASGGSSGGSSSIPTNCTPITASISPSSVTLKNGLAPSITVSGTARNCTQYIKRFRINFSEPARPASGGLNMPVVTCTLSGYLLPLDYISSGKSFGYTKSFNITPVAVTDPSTCTGTHTVKVDLIDRGLGTILGTTYVTYTVNA